MAAKLTASTSSTEMLTYVISSLASEESPGVQSSFSHHALIQHNLLVASQESNPDNSPLLLRYPSSITTTTTYAAISYSPIYVYCWASSQCTMTITQANIWYPYLVILQLGLL
ncbi:hypothetical protein Adt_14293 [Abeliophyllum distichum]|uniref:Uncharacterized protein n=1 Tax=Abeliophyllum distichum TaxID=126358 RepID=A0ABD1TZA0_9LAMI